MSSAGIVLVYGGFIEKEEVEAGHNVDQAKGTFCAQAVQIAELHLDAGRVQAPFDY